jgi:TorA maturation chaperone TorD
MARFRHDLAELGLRRPPDIGEPEDHAAILCAVMSGCSPTFAGSA